MTDALNLTGQKLGNYRLHRQLGRGNMGVVYLATDEALLRPTAVKVMTWAPSDHDPEAWFLSEARHVAMLNHPSVVQIYSVARQGPYRYIAMEYVEGVSADQQIARDGAYSCTHATEIMIQLAAALALAHASGLIHRDVKPGNILLRRDGTAKLSDFGMAVSSLRVGARHVRAGTPEYFAPEIWRGEPASVATDIYAMGATYYYLLTGRPPLDYTSMAELEIAHQHHDIVVPSELTAELGLCLRIVQRCMAKQPDERFGSARDVEWELRGTLSELAAPRAAPPARARRHSTRPPPSAMDPIWRSRGFVREPFAAVDPRQPPYPLAHDELRRTVEAELGHPGATVLLTGDRGSGRSTIAGALHAAAGGRRAYIEVPAPDGAGDSVIQRIARSLGAVTGRAGASEIEGLVAALTTLAKVSPPLVVIDHASSSAPELDPGELQLLARAARATQYFSLLVVGPPALAVSDPALAVVSVPPLPLAHIGGYIDAWLRATRSRDAAPLVVSADAALLVGHRGLGNLHRINAIARQMLSSGRPVLTSWDAWNAADVADGFVAPDASPRPTSWPTLEVLTLLNACRAQAGVSPRARTADMLGDASDAGDTGD